MLHVQICWQPFCNIPWCGYVESHFLASHWQKLGLYRSQNTQFSKPTSICNLILRNSHANTSSSTTWNTLPTCSRAWDVYCSQTLRLGKHEWTPFPIRKLDRMAISLWMFYPQELEVDPLDLHTRIRGYYRKAVNRFGHATPIHIHTMFASVDIKLKSIWYRADFTMTDF